MAQYIATGNSNNMSSFKNFSNNIHPVKRFAGFTYLGLLFFIAAIGLGLATTGVVWHKVEQRAKEKELLFVGEQFRRAIGLYYDHTPGAVKQYPKTLENLLFDNRHVTTHHYLRKIYRDPMTGKPDWGLVTRPNGSIIGVYSKSELSPIKTANFKTEYESFQHAKSYKDWKFIYIQAQVIRAEP